MNKDIDEGDRIVAAIKGNYLAKHFPETWYKQEKIRREVESGIHADRDALRDKLRDLLLSKIKNGRTD